MVDDQPGQAPAMVDDPRIRGFLTNQAAAPPGQAPAMVDDPRIRGFLTNQAGGSVHQPGTAPHKPDHARTEAADAA